jgi:hypothetical protein
MGVKTGDKSRHHRDRRKKLARREQMRALRKEMALKAAKTKTEIAAPQEPR